ncbi:unnamed protein product [Parajaminaea phylloscopi]
MPDPILPNTPRGDLSGYRDHSFPSTAYDPGQSLASPFFGHDSPPFDPQVAPKERFDSLCLWSDPTFTGSSPQSANQALVSSDGSYIDFPSFLSDIRVPQSRPSNINNDNVSPLHELSAHADQCGKTAEGYLADFDLPQWLGDISSEELS